MSGTSNSPFGIGSDRSRVVVDVVLPGQAHLTFSAVWWTPWSWYQCVVARLDVRVVVVLVARERDVVRVPVELRQRRRAVQVHRRPRRVAEHRVLQRQLVDEPDLRLAALRHHDGRARERCRRSAQKVVWKPGRISSLARPSWDPVAVLSPCRRDRHRDGRDPERQRERHRQAGSTACGCRARSRRGRRARAGVASAAEPNRPTFSASRRVACKGSLPPGLAGRSR